MIFLGTPAFAVPSLDALWRLQQGGAISVVGVVTQPDRPGNRGRVTSPAVKDRATALGVPVLQPAKLGREAVDEITSLRPDVLVMNLGYRTRILLALGRKEEAVATARIIGKDFQKSPAH